MSTATVTSKGQITIPKEVRKKLSLKAGDRVSFQIREGNVVEIRRENADLMSLFGIFKPSVTSVTLEDMNEAIREGAAREGS